MADEVNKKDYKYYDIEPEDYKEDLESNFKQLTKEIMDEIDEVKADPKPKQTVTEIFNTRLNKNK